MPKPSLICIFGDSTAWGAWDLEGGGWVGRLWQEVGIRSGDDYVEIYNLSVSGGTTQTILDRFEHETKVRQAVNGGPVALIFQTGGNDASYEGAGNDGKYMVSPEQFKRNLEEIIKRAKNFTNQILFLDLKNCDESKTMPVSWLDIYYTNANLQKYNSLMKEVCERQQVDCLDLAPLDKTDFYDGLHPNSSGHQKIFQQVNNWLVEKKWI